MNTDVIILQGGRNRCTPTNWTGSGHWSSEARLYAPVAGGAWAAVDGHRQALHPAQLYFIPPHHRIEYGTRDEFVVDWLHFRPVSSLLDLGLSRVAAIQRLTNRWSPVTGALAQFFDQPGPALSCRVHALILEVLGEVLERNPYAPAGSERLFPALQFMDDHAMSPPDLSTIAGRVNLSSGHFHRLFRQTFRTTPFEYLLRRRMAKAHQLLLEGSKSVKEVSTACGYDDPYYFSRLFRQRRGASPRDVRLGKTSRRP